jgi:hypothetical protein
MPSTRRTAGDVPSVSISVAWRQRYEALQEATAGSHHQRFSLTTAARNFRERIFLSTVLEA